MSDFDNTNRVSLWNGDKSKNANAPDLRGTVNVNGQEFNISLWTNNKATGPKSPSMTGSVELKQAGGSYANAGGYAQAPQHAAPVGAPLPNNGRPQF